MSATLPGLDPGRVYHYRLTAENPTGTVSGDDRVFVAGSSPASDPYRDAVLATSGLADYWRLGELSGTTSKDETSATTAISWVASSSASPASSGRCGTRRRPSTAWAPSWPSDGSALGAGGTVEGWFRWHSGRTVLRDNTGPSRGWMPALAGRDRPTFLTYRVGGPSIDTGKPIDLVRDGEWHHIVVTKNGSSAALYVDGAPVHTATNATDSATLPPAPGT